MIIPAKYLPQAEKKIDFDSETAAFLAGHFYLPDGYALPSPYVAWYSMLELITSDYFLHPLECSPDETFRALALLNAGRAGVRAADAFRRGDTAELTELADRFSFEHGTAVIAALDEVINQTLVIPFQGLEMLPQGEHKEKPFIFDSEFLASVCGSVAMTTGEDVDTILWVMPLLHVGYIRVFRARYEGDKAVSRKSNREAVNAAIEEAKAREDRGELHPWQIAEPRRYLPTEKQRKANPDIMKQHLANLAKEKNELENR